MGHHRESRRPFLMWLLERDTEQERNDRSDPRHIVGIVLFGQVDEEDDVPRLHIGEYATANE